VLDVYPVDGPWPGQLALCARPRAGNWLEDDIRSLKMRGYDLLVTVLTPQEIARLGLHDLAYRCHLSGVRSVQFPIGNMLVPDARAILPSLQEWKAALDEGQGVALHCFATVGRSPTMAAALLVMGGVEPEAAWARLNLARGREVPDTREQREWVWQLTGKTFAEPG
jgi:protein-tyrosine phosphatase